MWASVVLCAALFAGCAGVPGRFAFDETVPAEQSTLVVFGTGIRVLEYNGIDIRTGWYPNDKWRVNRITLPIGETTILFNYFNTINMGNTAYYAHSEDITLKFTFEAGKEYTVASYTRRKGLFTKEYGVAVWELASQTGSPATVENAVKFWKFGEV
jgi:hypothetical protein